ncbi:hypothetical protein [Sporosarcina pasteurii]|uniref:Tubby C-terminal domain-containing protein n=1 Tax=Sporosarcina pasteurii TaxID=1474 RepID=A0A380C2U1_SPOPA|nr:hypothetical protein [Sporosarcina pasteurii]MDS9471558.1 hypothetical protein [Sporosarcina pasteurii]QBQ04827.1 hypothetical protein E2C16_03680 [Sporosarcina pasteurii]SUJ11073.1 Uncharacterised protein [Sporosarcina pasteurii]
MEYFTVLPMWNYSGKQIEIIDTNSVRVGFIKRTYKSFWDKLLHYLPITISFLETINIDGENNGHQLKIREQSFKSNLLKLKWDIFLEDTATESQFLLEDKTKISTNPHMVYHKNNNEYVFRKDLFNRTCKISVNDEVCATIRVEKKIPLSLKAVVKTNDLTILELLGIYFVISLAY